MPKWPSNRLPEATQYRQCIRCTRSNSLNPSGPPWPLGLGASVHGDSPMNTTQKAFRSLQAETMSTKSLSEVTKWLETLVNLVFPENGIEYWSEGDLFET